MEFYAFHGHYEEEQAAGNLFSVNVTVETDISEAVKTDRLDRAIDYTRIYLLVKQEMEIPSRLLENVAGRIIEKIHGLSAHISRVTVTVSKLNPAMGGQMKKFSVVHSG